MYKYTADSLLKHDYDHAGKRGRWSAKYDMYKTYCPEFPGDWHCFERLMTIEYYSLRKLREVPVNGILIPKSFFKEELIE